MTNYQPVRVRSAGDEPAMLRLADADRAYSVTVAGEDQAAAASVVEQIVADAAAQGMTVHLLEGERQATAAMRAAVLGRSAHGHADCLELAQCARLAECDDAWRAAACPGDRTAGQPRAASLFVILGAASTFKTDSAQWEKAVRRCQADGVAVLVVVDRMELDQFGHCSSLRQACATSGVVHVTRSPALAGV
jgi:hypothetical protein